MTCNNDDADAVEISGQTPCGEETTVTTTCGVVPACSCGCDPCGCGTLLVPFYNAAPACQETHTKVCSSLVYTTAITIGVAFNMPACDAYITVKLPGLKKLQVGSYLWNATYGYLKVISFDCMNEQAVLVNECQTGNAAPGTSIPGCTLFNVVDPPYDPGSGCGDGVFVTADFTMPALLGTVDVDVTSTEGLVINEYVQVGTGLYILYNILTPNQIQLYNFGGAGVVPGLVVSAYDAQGNCIVPVTLQGQTPCTASPSVAGSLVICSLLGQTTTLEATAIGQVPVCTDAANNTFQAQNVYIDPPICTTLTACLTLIAGVNTYNLVVVDSSSFADGDVIVISYPTVDDILWVVTNVPDPTHITIAIVDAPNTVDEPCIPDGTSVCHGSCCSQIAYDLEQSLIICNQDWSAAQKTDVQLVWEADEPSGGSFIVLAAGDPPFNSDLKTINFSNDTCNPLQVMLTVDYIIQMGFDTNEFAWARFAMTPYTGLSTVAAPGVPAVPVLAPLRALYDERTFGVGNGGAGDKYTSLHHMQYHHTEVITVPANTNLRYDARLDFDYLIYRTSAQSACPCGGMGTIGTGNVELTDVNTFIHAIGVAVQAA